MPRSAIAAVARRVDGKAPLSVEQYTALADRAVELLGSPEGWSKQAWREVGEAARGIAVQDIAKLKKQGVEELSAVIGLNQNQLSALLERCSVPAACGEAVVLTLDAPAKYFATKTPGLANLEAVGQLVAKQSPAAAGKATLFASRVKQFAMEHKDVRYVRILPRQKEPGCHLDGRKAVDRINAVEHEGTRQTETLNSPVPTFPS